MIGFEFAFFFFFTVLISFFFFGSCLFRFEFFFFLLLLKTDLIWNLGISVWNGVCDVLDNSNLMSFTVRSENENGYELAVDCWWVCEIFGVQLTETISTAEWFWSTTHRNYFHSKMVLEYNLQKPFLSSSSNCVSPKLNDDNDSRSLVFFTCWKPLSTSNGFGVQLTETISTAKWFWHIFI